MADFSVGIVGLDSLGSALTRRLDQQGIGHTATDLNARLLQSHLAGGGSAPAGSPYDLAQLCDLILLTETSDETLRESVLGSVGLVHALRPGTIIVDMSDGSPQAGPALARALYSKGAIWIEATPVGGPQELRAGKLTLLTAGAADALERITPVLRTFAAKILRLGELGTGPLAKALASAFGAVSIAIHAEMLIVAKMAGLDPTGVLDALSLLAPGMGTAPAAVRTQVLTGRYDSDLSSRRLQEDICRVLDAARTGAVPTLFLPLLQAAAAAASHSPHATGGALDIARWMADNAGIEFTDASPAAVSNQAESAAAASSS
ncbi:MAG TPA: NAD(P)-binding domain-containing protein [Xanthobacteraceae bacterium]|nr:NAD(P)-binding domain-containing protein [Xanthobacteraceae bacterium]